MVIRGYGGLPVVRWRWDQSCQAHCLLSCPSFFEFMQSFCRVYLPPKFPLFPFSLCSSSSKRNRKIKKENGGGYPGGSIRGEEEKLV